MARRDLTPQELLEKIKSNQELTSPEQTSLDKILYGAAKGTVPSQFKSADEFDSWLKNFGGLKDSPAMQAYAQNAMSSRIGDRYVQYFKPLLSSILAGADISTSLGQIRASNNAVSRLQRPTFGVPSVVNPAINQEIYRSQMAGYDAARALSPAKQAILDAYNAQLSQAKQIGGGQAGTTQALGQAAYNDRLRATGTLPQIQDNIRRQYMSNTANLLGIQQQGAMADANNQLAAQNLQANQYGLDATTAAMLGVTGRSNLRNVFQTLPDNLLQAAGRLAPVPQAGIQTTGSKYDDYYGQVQQGLASTISNAQKWMNNNFITR